MSEQKSVGEILDETIEPLFPGAVFPNVYRGELAEYVVYNYDILNALSAESAPQAAVYLVQVHLYYPEGKNPTDAILALDRALWNAGFTWPSLTNVSDGEGQHYALECKYTDGGGYYGFI